MAALKRAAGEPVDFVGVGGDRMVAEGLDSLFPLSELSVMGIAEVIPHIRRLLGRISETAQAVRDAQPDVIVTIDAPAFCLRVLRRLRDSSAVKVHFVAPTVWAWRPWRARKMASLVDHLMTLLPFEPPYFEAVGLSTDFVGHPVLERNVGDFDGSSFRQRHNVGADAPLLCLLPGSRRGEMKYLLPPFREAVTQLTKRNSALRVVVPTLAGLSGALRAEFQHWPIPVTVVDGEQDKFSAMAASDVALAASGTVALELALFGVPNVIAYRVHPLTAAVVGRLVKVKYANLVNLLVDREAVPEFIQARCRGDLLADAVEKLLTDADAVAAQKAAMRDAMSQLSAGPSAPSDMAAKSVLKIAAKCSDRSRPVE